MSKKPEEKKVFLRAFIVYVFSGIIAILVIGKMIYIQAVEGEDLIEMMDVYKSKKVSGRRGKIFSSDGSLLATDVPLYRLKFDTRAADSALFYENIDSLSSCLSNYLSNEAPADYAVDERLKRKSAIECKNYFKKRREAPDRLIFKNLTEEQVDELLQFPLFNISDKAKPGRKRYVRITKDKDLSTLTFNIRTPNDSIFNANVGSLSEKLSFYFRDKTPEQYKKILLDGRKVDGSSTVVIARCVDYYGKERIKSFPIFSKPQNTGGLIVEDTMRRRNPFGNLAPRTIGRVGKPYGLEAWYNEVLSGKNDSVLQKRIPGDMWVNVDDDIDRSSLDGKDIVTTLDVHLQDIAAAALREQLKAQKAKSGCAVLMEVKTGEIKAITNLSMSRDSSYIENKNFAVGDPYEPGSTFKLMTMVAGFEDGLFSLDEEFNTGNGTYKIGKHVISDDVHAFGTISLRRVFELSSNVGTVMAVVKHYGNNPKKYFNTLFRMGLNQRLGVDIPGEAEPVFSKSRDLATMMSMSYGYSLSITPLQILAFYNAIANNGVMMKPMFVKKIQRGGLDVEVFEPVVLRKVCSEKNAKIAQELLRGVVDNGTGKNVFNTVFPVAGKTGTAKMVVNGGYSETDYNASFVGYFPADDPQYSCIVLVSKPSQGKIFGGTVAAPVFLEIAEKVYASNSELKGYVDGARSSSMPLQVFAKAKNVDYLYNAIGINNSFVKTTSKNDYAKIFIINDSLVVETPSFDNSRVPDLKGMSVNEAVSLLESLGAKVSISGKGWVVDQNPAPGVPFKQGLKIKLILGQR